MSKKTAFKSAGRLYVLLTVLFLIITNCDSDPFFIPVKYIDGVPDTGTAKKPSTLTGTVHPVFANNNVIIWSIVNDGGTGAVINGNILTTEKEGNVLIKARVANGLAEGKDFTQDFKIVFTAKDSNEDPDPEEGYVHVTHIALSQTSLNLTIGDTETLTAIITPGNAENKTVTWSSSAPAVATVSAGGLVTAVADGNAIITVRTNDGGITAACTVTVQTANVAVTGVTLSQTSLNLTIGATETLTATIAPIGATNKTVTWSSSNSDVATVNDSGIVTAVTVGSATITVRTEDGNKTATCVVTVTKVTGAAVTTPTVSGSPTSNSITVNAVTLATATGQSIEYAISTASDGTGLSAYQSGTTFTGLNSGTTYYVYARSVSNENYNAGATNVSAAIKTAVTVTFNSNDGTNVSPQTITAGSVATRPTNPSRTDYFFDYWYENSELTTPYNFSTPVSANITLYAKWFSKEEIIQEIANNMVSISAGTFQMGSPNSESGRSTDETQHSVTLSAFSMSKYQVTQDQYQAVIGTNPSNFKTTVTGENGTPGKLPVENVSWYDALVFCNKLSIMVGLTPAYSISGKTNPTEWGTVPTTRNTTWDAVQIVSGSTGYRLPTEAQWEYACRAGTTTAYNTGASINTNAAWYTTNSTSKTHQVGLKTANVWGLYDMHGNVREMCWDWYLENYYSNSPDNDPMGPVPDNKERERVLRGGYYGSTTSNPADMRSAYRATAAPQNRGGSLGFRIVRP